MKGWLIMEIFDFLNGLFYGEQWYIYWGIVAVPCLIGLISHMPKFIKSVKEMKKRIEK